MSIEQITTTSITFAAGNFGSPLQLIILLAIVLLLFGGNRLRNLGGDIGAAIKGFKTAMNPDEEKEKEKSKDDALKIIDGKIDSEKVINPKVDADRDQHKS
jgi:sec-independent protein translocase protein TatA